MIYTAAKIAYKQYDDDEIIGKINEGDHPLYEIIVRRYNPYLYKIGRSYGFNHQDTEDLMQNTYLNAFYNLQKFQFKATFKTWMTRIMLNQCYQGKQRHDSRNNTITASTPDNVPEYVAGEEGRTVEHKFISKELGQIIESAIHQLPENSRMVFTLRELNQHSVAETADILGISENNVKVRLNRAKALIKEILQAQYAPDYIFEFNEVYCNAMVKRVLEKIL